jgi:hypothetical protein
MAFWQLLSMLLYVLLVSIIFLGAIFALFAIARWLRTFFGG